MSLDTFESVRGKLKQWHLKFPPFDICRRAYVHSIICLGAKCPHMQILRGDNFLRGGGGGGSSLCISI